MSDLAPSRPWFNKLPPKDRAKIANGYFAIGHNDFDDDLPESQKIDVIWLFNPKTKGLEQKRGGTHGFHWSGVLNMRAFKDRYDGLTKAVSIYFPDRCSRHLEARPTEADIPSDVHRALKQAFTDLSRIVTF